MKTILFILSFVCLFNFNTYSQSNCACDDSQIELLAYVPMRTYHFDRTPSLEYHKTEGGNIGVVGVYRKTKKNNIFYDTNFGIIRNSYNKVSVIAQKGIGFKTRFVNVSVNLGLVSGYKILFVESIATTRTITIDLPRGELFGDSQVSFDRTTTRHIKPSVIKEYLPEIMREWGIIPTANLSISLNTGMISPMLVISPEYLNAGILVKF